MKKMILVIQIDFKLTFSFLIFKNNIKKQDVAQSEVKNRHFYFIFLSNFCINTPNQKYFRNEFETDKKC